jgi:preprotein translocase subunit Sss1
MLKLVNQTRLPSQPEYPAVASTTGIGLNVLKHP